MTESRSTSASVRSSSFGKSTENAASFGGDAFAPPSASFDDPLSGIPVKQALFVHSSQVPSQACFDGEAQIPDRAPLRHKCMRPVNSPTATQYSIPREIVWELQFLVVRFCGDNAPIQNARHLVWKPSVNGNASSSASSMFSENSP